MQIRPTIGWAWRVVLSAMLTLVLAVAPLAAQIVMASHVHAAAPATAGAQTHHHHAGATHQHSHASHDHGASASHHHHPDGVPDPVEHDDGPDTGCCGTFCHSACAMMSILQVRHPIVRPSFDRQLFQRFAAVDPDQPQRPPSVLLSL